MRKGEPQRNDGMRGAGAMRKDCRSYRARLEEADLPKMERVQSVLQKVHSTPPGPGFSRCVAAPGAGPSGLTHIQVLPGAAR